MLFRDRIDAGRRLAEELSDYAARRDVIVLALPRVRLRALLPTTTPWWN